MVIQDDNSDELLLYSLELYQRAVERVARDFRQRGAGVKPLEVQLDDLDAIELFYERPGWTGAATLGSLPVVHSVEQAVVALADLLQEKEIEAGDNTWPGCRGGHSHPPAAALLDGDAWWRCPSDSVGFSLIDGHRHHKVDP
ncbi:hypothetical protein [Micromonospora zamorensis]|uniref:hypothetical protein n=1 Tax=Micromonospora zamorensis TaxID=709883 RepID=UPI003CEC31DE